MSIASWHHIFFLVLHCFILVSPAYLYLNLWNISQYISHKLIIKYLKYEILNKKIQKKKYSRIKQLCQFGEQLSGEPLSILQTTKLVMSDSWVDLAKNRDRPSEWLRWSRQKLILLWCITTSISRATYSNRDSFQILILM